MAEIEHAAEAIGLDFDVDLLNIMIEPYVQVVIMACATGLFIGLALFAVFKVFGLFNAIKR